MQDDVERALTGSYNSDIVRQPPAGKGQGKPCGNRSMREHSQVTVLGDEGGGIIHGRHFDGTKYCRAQGVGVWMLSTVLL